MGITIHIRGRLKDMGRLDDLVDEVVDTAKTLGWKRKVLRDTPLKGVVVTPHKKCEPLMLLFDDAGVLRNCVLHPGEHDDVVGVKTQYASVDVHVALCKFLKHLAKRYFAQIEVVDDGRYWETGDRATLERAFEANARAIGAVASALKRRPRPHPEEGPEDIARRVEEAAQEAHDDLNDPGRAALDRLNGPQAPFEDEEALAWTVEDWADFWERWDAHRVPMIDAMRGKPDTLESVRTAMEHAERVHEREKIDQKLVKRRHKRLRKRRVEREPVDLPPPEPEEPWKDSVPTYDRERDREALERESPAFVKANEWMLRAYKSFRANAEHPIYHYVRSVVAVAVVGMRMAWVDAHEDGRPLAWTGRLRTCGARFAQIARLLRSEPALGAASLAAEADKVSAALLREAR